MNKSQTPILGTRMKIIGVGASMLDIIAQEDSESVEYCAGGTCGNVLAGLATLGWKAVLVSRVGEDITGKKLIRDLEASSIDIEFVTREKNIQTPRIIEKLSNNGQYPKHRFLLRCPKCNTYLPRFRSPKISCVSDITETHEKPDVFFFDKITPSSMKLAELYREAGALIFFEPEHPDRKHNVRDAVSISHIVKYASHEDSQRRNIEETYNIPGMDATRVPQLIIETYGQYGLSYKLNNSEWLHRPSFGVANAVDSCGAGDWCTTGFLFKLAVLSKERNIALKKTLSNSEIVDSAIKYSQILSSLSCMFVGAQGMSCSMDGDDILSFMDSLERDSNRVMLLISEYFSRDRKSLKPGHKKTRKTKKDACPVCLMDAS